MSQKYCIDQRHEGDGHLPLEDFYRNPKTLDGRLGICKTCSKRRATERENRFRAERKAQGLSCVPSADERAEREIERDIEAEAERQFLREEEARQQHAVAAVQPSSEDRGGLGFGLTEVFEKKFTTVPLWRVC